jgi:cysteinyl-tRNA synthetase
MPLALYNTLTKRKQPFTPIHPGRVTLYCCGVTVYDDCHLGHARSYLGWDVLRRYLGWRGYGVHYVQNFTDIDDKILNRASAEGTTMAAVSERYIQRYFEDMHRLNVMDADEYPRVTEHIEAIHTLIGQLEDKGLCLCGWGRCVLPGGAVCRLWSAFGAIARKDAGRSQRSRSGCHR